MNENQALGRAAGLIRHGEHAAAEKLLREILQVNPRSETAWLWMAVVERDPVRQSAYLDRVLALNPQHEGARRLLETLDRQAAVQRSTGVPPDSVEERAAARSLPGEGTAVCPQCGEDTRAGARFCTHCGYRLGGIPPAEGQAQDSSGTLEEVDPVTAKLEAARRDLLDMSLNNRLLNYRPLKSKGLEFVGADPATVYRVLVLEGRKMSFLPAPEERPATESSTAREGAGDDQPEGGASDEEAAAEGRYDECEEHESERVAAEDDGAPEGVRDDGLESGSGVGSVAAEGRDDEQGEQDGGVIAENKLQTPYPVTVLQKRLLNTYYAARTYVEEQGVNTLFVALGMLCWYESPESETVRLAPLILVPVELDRTNVRARFRIQYGEDEIGGNLSLRAKLGTEFSCTLPTLPEAEDVDVEAYCAQVERAIAHLPRWSVDRQAAVLGFFSFGKFLMFHDLHAANWPDDALPADHRILRALLHEGFAEEKPSVPDEVRIDDWVPPDRLHQVVDADGSQTLAILDVTEGRNLVIQGPPGTGKSQTITNLIAEAMAAGQSVLFVSEKMAALEVVKRRLDNVGLGDACLELHSQKTRKTLVLEDLRRTLELGRPREGMAVDLDLLAETRARLNDYCDAVNQPIGESMVSPFRAYGELLALERRLGDLALPAMDGRATRHWARADVERAAADVEELRALVVRIGVPADHPFWGSRHRMVVPAHKEAIWARCETALDATAALEKAATALANHMGVGVPDTAGQAEADLLLARHVLGAPELGGVHVNDPDWADEAGLLAELMEAGARIQALHTQYDVLLRDAAWETDVEALAQTVREVGPHWWRPVVGRYRRARATLAGLCRARPPRPWTEQLALLDAIEEVRARQAFVENHAAQLEGLYGPQWRGLTSDWAHLAEVARWLGDLQSQVRSGTFPREVLAYLAARPDLAVLRADADLVTSALADHADAVGDAVAAVDLDEAARFGADACLAGQRFALQEEVLTAWQDNVDRIQETVALNHVSDRARAHGLEDTVQAAARWPEAGQYLGDAFWHAWYSGLLERALAERPALAAFHGQMHSQAVRRFRELDKLSLIQNRARLVLKHWESLPKYTAGGQLGVLQREFAKRRRHLPIRQLIRQAGNVIQAIKPVFMMSPLSIAMFLPPGSVDFDMVVFDEASQVKPVDAFGAVLRGKQVVVVGDTRQLPPTTFFENVLEADEEEVEHVTGDLESVLGLCYAQGMPSRMLRWHYRSRHESLIAVSNQAFYENKLVVFPSPDAGKASVGLVYHHLPDTVYGRGRSRANLMEAQMVAEAVMQHAKTRPDQTLGVAAFSISQMEAIQDQLEALRRRDPSCEGYFQGHSHEPFFVKNLENVQGDERDVVYISVGYGRTADGQVSMNFGPLNREGGERRLNVLITRARQRCEIYTNLAPEDIDLSRSSAQGVAVLKRYLAYARDGDPELGTVGYSDEGTRFAEAVAGELEGRGYSVRHRVGSAGYAVDLAVLDEEQPGRYVLGIEYDGPTYYGTASARDRDRLREEVLEGLGWHMHRIWSTDWFQNVGRETARLVGQIEEPRTEDEAEAVAGEAAGIAAAAINGLTYTEIARDRARARRAPAVPMETYRRARLRIAPLSYELHRAPVDRIGRWIGRIVAVEGPVHEEIVTRRIAEAAGVKRVGRRIQALLTEAVAYAAAQGLVQVRGAFLWAADQREPVLRRRNGLPASERQFDYVPPEELALAVERVVSTSYGMRREEIAPEVAHLLGFSRVSEQMAERVEVLIGAMIAEGRLGLQGTFVVAEE